MNTIVYQEGQRATHIILRDNLFDWKSKAPFELSGCSILGAIEYDEGADEVKCHDCGEWTKNIGRHLVGINQSNNPPIGHSLTSRAYRLRHGFILDGGTQLCTLGEAKKRNEINREARSRKVKDTTFRTISPKKRSAMERAQTMTRIVRGQASNSERMNLIGCCKAQRIALLRKLGKELGRTPTKTELLGFIFSGRKPLQPKSLSRLFGKPMADIMKEAGLTPRMFGVLVRKKEVQADMQIVRPEQILAEFRNPVRDRYVECVA